MIEVLKSNSELWDIFTRKEEYNPTSLDQYGRFQSASSNNKNLQTPIVSKYLLEHGLVPEYPDGHSFAICLTHDVDILNHKYETSWIKRTKSSRFVRWAFRVANRLANPVWTFKEILRIEKEYDAKSSFYFQAFRSDDLDFNYVLEDVVKELGIIADSGCEIGLHGSYDAYDDIDKLRSEKRRIERVIGRKVTGYRNHYLRFKVPTTWRMLSEAGFKYDTTMGYAENMGFRNGMCHPFMPFDLEKNQVIDIVELPLAIMDGTLDSYLKLDVQKAWDAIRPIIDTCKQNKGVFTVLWHNHYFRGQWKDLYEKILSYCGENNAWLTNSEQIVDWWKKNNCFEKV